MISFSAHSRSYALEMIMNSNTASDACILRVPSPHSLYPDSKCPHLHNSSYSDVPLKFYKKQSIPKCYHLPYIRQFNNYLSISRTKLCTQCLRGEVKSCLGLIWACQQKFPSATYLTFLIFSSEPLFSDYQDDSTWGQGLIFIMKLFIEHSARVGGEVQRVWIGYVDKWDMNP